MVLEAFGNGTAMEPLTAHKRYQLDDLFSVQVDVLRANRQQLFTRRTGALLRHQKKRGIPRSVKDEKYGRFDLWEIAV